MLTKTSMAVFIAFALVLSACQSNQAKTESTSDPDPAVDAVAQKKKTAGEEFIVEEVVVEEVKPEEVKPEQVKQQVSAPESKALPKHIKSHPSDSRMDYAANLIYRSTAAQQIKNSQNQQAHKLYQDAQSLYKKISLTSGSPEKNKQLLDEALTKMFSAVQMAEPEKVRAEKSRRDFTKKKESIQALLDAHDRVAKEKNKSSQGDIMHKQISELLTQANALYQQGEYSQGKGILDGALNIVKTSIEQMRGGDTLVKGLNFESKKEEYAYELDRNDTHTMLIKVLLSEKRKNNPELDKRVRQALDISGQYRQKAEQMALKNDYQTAIDWLEKATLELVKVIRRGGIYIPSA